MIQIYLPGIKLTHLKRSIKFLYSGQLKVTKSELERDNFLYHVNLILQEIFRVDADFNIDSRYLVPPTTDSNEQDPPPPSDDDNNNGDEGYSGDQDDDGDQGGSGEENYNSVLFSSQGCDIEGTRQNTGLSQEQKYEEQTSELDQQTIEHSNQMAGTEEILQEFIVIPQLAGEELQGAIYHYQDIQDAFIEEPCQYQTLADMGIEEIEGNSAVAEIENIGIDAEDIVVTERERHIATPEIQDLLYSDGEEEVGEANKLDMNSLWSLSPSGTKPELETDMDVKETEDESKENLSTNNIQSTSRLDSDVQDASSSQNESKKVRTSKVKKSGSQMHKGGKKVSVRKHHHVPWTISGIKRPDTEAVIKEESGLYSCDLCEATYDKARSLRIHMGRKHSDKATVPCPEGCGKMLTTSHAIKKHLLSHRPEKDWPFECPICHKRFQARGDIPKHLKTKLHENDNIPVMGSKVKIQANYTVFKFHRKYNSLFAGLERSDPPRRPKVQKSHTEYKSLNTLIVTSDKSDKSSNPKSQISQIRRHYNM